MSHFTVAVICNDVSEVPSLLAPYQENNMDDCPKEFLVFNDVEEESRNEWETKTKSEWYADFRHRIIEDFPNSQKDSVDIEAEIEKIKSAGIYSFMLTDGFDRDKANVGNTVSICGHVNNENGKENFREVFIRITESKNLTAEQIKSHLGISGLLRIRRNFETKYEFENWLKNRRWKNVSGIVIDGPSEIPLKTVYPVFENFMENWVGSHIDPETGKWGYWENPNAKWDWYTIGGRWMGSLLVKEDNEGEIGRPGTFKNEVPNTPRGYKWVDVCKISDVQWDKMFEISKFELLKNEAEDGDIWDILTEKIKIDERKKLNYGWYKPEYYIDRYGTKENYIKSVSSFGTYAVITPDGKWHAPGDMGWFGCSTESNDEKREFEDNFHKNFIEPNQDKFIVIVDCHI